MAAPGDFVLVRYAVVGPTIYHERRITGVSATIGWYAQLSTDGDHYLEDFDANRNGDIMEVRWLASAGSVPYGVAAAEIYAFDLVLAPADWTQLLRDGSHMALIHGGGPPLLPLIAVVGDPLAPPAAGPAALAAPAGVAPLVFVAGPVLSPGQVWVISEDRGGYAKGDQLAVLPEGTLGVGDRGIFVCPSGEPIFVQAMAPVDVSAFLAGDARTLAVRFDPQGQRRRTFAEAVALMSEDPLPGGWPIEGPRAALGTLKAILDCGGSPEVEHDAWVRTARIPDGDRSIHEDEVISVVLQQLAMVDQLNMANLAGVELLIRRRALIREAHRLSPSALDYTGSHHYMGWQRRKDAGATNSVLTQHVAVQLRDEASIAKETRKAREERNLRLKPAPKPKGAGKGGGTEL